MNPPVPATNPIAKADRKYITAQVNSLVTLDGSPSSDPQSEVLTYLWVLNVMPAGSIAALADTASPITTFVADLGGSYIITLQVTNASKKVSNLAKVFVEAVSSGDNHPPTANAGIDQTVEVGSVAILDGSASFDPDGSPLRYLWRLIDTPAGSSPQFSGTNNNIAYLYPNVAGTYSVSLRVSDGIDSDDDTIVVTTGAQAPPVANAGDDQAAVVGDVVLLDGSGSTDADDDPLSYSWALVGAPSGSVSVLMNSNTAKPYITVDTVGNYTLMLTVSDGIASNNDAVGDHC